MEDGLRHAGVTEASPVTGPAQRSSGRMLLSSSSKRYSSTTDYPERLLALLEDGYDPATDMASPDALGDFEIRNIAVPTATTATLIDGQLPTALELIVERDINRDPSDGVEVITVTIGGNDVSNPAIQACVLDPTPTDCQAVVDTALVLAEARLTAILRALVASGDGGDRHLREVGHGVVGGDRRVVPPGDPLVEDPGQGLRDRVTDHHRGEDAGPSTERHSCLLPSGSTAPPDAGSGWAHRVGVLAPGTALGMLEELGDLMPAHGAWRGCGDRAVRAVRHPGSRAVPSLTCRRVRLRRRWPRRERPPRERGEGRDRSPPPAR